MSRKINWQNPQALIYEDNYGYGMNFYQPMIDYIDAKDRGLSTKHPHLPWTNERGLDKYSSRKLVESYSDQDLTNISRRTEARAKAKLKDFKATTKSKFQLCQSVSAASITRQVHTEVKRTKKSKIIKEIQKIKKKMSDDLDYEPDVTKIAEGLKSVQKYLRGKSAKGIEAQLLSESMKNIAEGGSASEIDIKKYQRNVFVNTYNASAHSKLMCDRMEQQLDESFMRPLDNLSLELKGFDKKTSQYFYEKR